MKNFAKLFIGTVLLVIICLTNTSSSSMQNNDPNDYSKLWKEVQEFDRKRKPKSALKTVESILALAKEESNGVQIIKATIYYNKYITQLEEDGFVKAINNLEEEIKVSHAPEKQILQSLLGQMYASYAQSNMYQISQRTTIANNRPKDILTWTLDDFISTSSDLYIQSITDPKLVDQPIQQFETLLNDLTQWNKEKTPNLYILLGNRALNHFANTNNYVTEPAYKFKLDQEDYFSKTEAFQSLEITTKDSKSLLLKALLLHQDVLNYIASSKNDPELLAICDLKRLQFVYNNSSLSNRKDLYIQSLQEFRDTYPSYSTFAEAAYHEASILHQQSLEKNDLSDYAKSKMKEALYLAIDAHKKYPKTFGGSLCSQLITTIKSKNISIGINQVEIPNKDFLIHLSHTNVDRIFFKIVKSSQEIIHTRNYKEYKEKFNYINSQEKVREWKIDDLNKNDLLAHNTELPVQGLEKGTYCLLASTEEHFKDQHGNAVYYGDFHISNLATISTTYPNKNTLLVMDRISGSAIEGATVDIYRTEYHSKTRINQDKLITSSTTNSMGEVEIPDGGHRRVFTVVKYKNDKLDLRNFFNPQSSYNKVEYNHSVIYTDRSIYRPGQTIHFKGILLNYDINRKPSIVPNKNLIVRFLDVNHQEIGQQAIKTNEYGSFSGHFIAPSSGLMGNMRIMIDGSNGVAGNSNIRVEEYKRPKFKAEILPVQGAFVLGDQIEVKGNATSFAGVALDDVKVKYEVVREARFPYLFYRWMRPPSLNTNKTIVDFGEISTNEKGEFVISFKADPDKSYSQKQQPVYHYKIKVDVVDLNGEVQSTQTTIRVSHTPFELFMDLKEYYQSDSLSEIPILVKNLNGQTIGQEVELHIEQLEEPHQFLRSKYWNIPNDQILDSIDYKNKFPLDTYGDERMKNNWTILRSIQKSILNTQNSTVLKLDNKLSAGTYRIKASSKDKKGAIQEIVRYISVYNHSMNEYSKAQLLFVNADKAVYHPGDFCEITLGSAVNFSVHCNVERMTGVDDHQVISLDGSNKLRFKISESDRGNVRVHFNYVYNNRQYVEQLVIPVPWNNKQLNISYLSFRDELLPGQNESWKLKISGLHKDAAQAELLASMYDVSLDQFTSHTWKSNFYPSLMSLFRTTPEGFYYQVASGKDNYWSRVPYDTYSHPPIYPIDFNWFGFNLWSGNIQIRGSRGMNKNYAIDGARPMMNDMVDMERAPMSKEMDAVMISSAKSKDQSTSEAGGFSPDEGINDDTNNTDAKVQIRENLNETVFFYPNLETDVDGNILIDFKMNEALTSWKFMTFAHDKDFAFAYSDREIVTKKDLMILPNTPRFLRQGDKISYSAKVSNISDRNLSARAELKIYDATSMQELPSLYAGENAQNIKILKGTSEEVSWKLEIPQNMLSTLAIKTIVTSDQHSDGELNIVPVLSNRQLVTETLAMNVKSGERKTFEIKGYANKHNSSTLRDHKLTLEFTSNPVWYAVQALPYLMEFPHECSEQLINRYFANQLAENIVNSTPKIKAVFDQWKITNSDALKSNLFKNQELKSALIEETPWLLNAMSEDEQKRNIALLFDLNTMSNSKNAIVKKLRERQSSNGGFPWFEGRDNQYISQYIAENIGHLQKLNILDKSQNDMEQILSLLIPYLDQRIKDSYEDLLRRKRNYNLKLSNDHLSYYAIHYLYVRSFFKEYEIAKEIQEAYDYYYNQASKYWNNKNLYSMGLIALSQSRSGDIPIAKEIAASVMENSLYDEELGRYWKIKSGYNWYQMPLETQSLFIEMFWELDFPQNDIEDMQIWLLKNKQTNRWSTTKSTSAAIYALLINQKEGKTQWIDSDSNPEIRIGNDELSFEKEKIEAGTGYIKKQFQGEDMTPDKARIEVYNPNEHISWGGVYWQYFEDLDKITDFQETPLTINKKLFKREMTDRGERLIEVKNDPLNVGDQLIVRIELRVDREMEFVHMKDMRSSGFEPKNVLSQYKWQDGLGYYESTKDLATHFFFDQLPKGTFVFEYGLKVQHKGDFSNGITTIQCMYAPEFSSHSSGIKCFVK